MEGQYAEDAAAAASYALRCAAGGGTGLAMSAAQRGYESVDAVLQYELGFDYTRPGHEQRMQEHPLSRAEFARQERDLAELEAIAQDNELPAAVRRLRGRAQAEPIH